MNESRKDLSPRARATVRKLLRYGEFMGGIPWEISKELSGEGLWVQTSNPIHEPKFSGILCGPCFRFNARGLGFDAPDPDPKKISIAPDGRCPACEGSIRLITKEGCE